MPSSARKSSIGAARRGIQKAHIPYRGDNPEIGKKTGIAVHQVQRTSDGFEPFEQLMQQADNRTPPRPKGRKKSIPAKQPRLDSDDENGEMSMDIDNTPVGHLSNSRIPSTPVSRNRSGLSRAVARSAEVDFDEIPSPRSHLSTSRTAKAGPSRLSKSTIAQNLESESDNEPADYGGYGNDMDISGTQDMNGDYGTPDSPQRSSPRRKSFAQMDQSMDGPDDQEDQEGDDYDEPPQPSPGIDKGKRKARLEDIEEEEEDEQVEDEIAQDLHDLENEESGREEHEPSPPSKKKLKFSDEQERSKKIKPSKSQKENREPREGIRRSKRERFQPLEWWRGEKVVYGRINTAEPILVPTIKEIRRIPSDQPMPFGQKRRGHHRGRSKTADDKLATAVYNPEEGWDDATDPFGEVYNVDKQALAVQRLVWTAKHVVLSKVANSEWLFQRIFSDSDFIAAGQLVIPPDCRKPTKMTKDNTYIFYVIEGAVNFKVHEVSKVVTTGGMFMAPRGNTYLIENISTRDAKLFFTQARKLPKDELEPSGSVGPPRREKKKSLEEVRSSSPGRASLGTASGRTAQSLPPPQAPQARQSKAGKRAPSAKV